MGKVESVKEFALVGLNRLDRALEGLSEEQLDWKSCPEANTIRNILTHLISEWRGFIPKIIAGDKDAQVEGVPEGYVGNPELSLGQLKADYEEAKRFLMSQLEGLKEEDLEKPMDWFMGEQTVGRYLLLGISEIHHHEGQIAAILGLEKRIKGG